MRFVRTGVLSLLRVPPGSVLAEIEVESFDDDPSINGREVLRFASEHAPALCTFVGKPCRIVLEFDESETPPDVSSYEDQLKDFARRSVATDSEPYMHGVGWTDKDGVAHHVRKDWTIGPPIQGKKDPAVNPLDEGWRRLRLALASYGFELTFDAQLRHVFRLSKLNPDTTTTYFTVCPTDDDALSFLDIGFHAVNDLLGKAVMS